VDPLSDIEAIKRLGVAMLVGVLLGFEREQRDKPAGMRTYMLVVEGAALFMICAILLSNQMALEGRISDPGRIASTVIQGIGFIAAGVIITTGRQVVGGGGARSADWRGVLRHRPGRDCGHDSGDCPLWGIRAPISRHQT
jgi:uncharacterized membrane protein YhiD involved in acid resistance